MEADEGAHQGLGEDREEDVRCLGMQERNVLKQPFHLIPYV
jgi:hypothetical protein